MIKALVFDFDGVIVTGSNAGYLACYHQALAHVGVTIDPALERERILERWGMGGAEQLKWLLQEQPEKVDAAAKFFENCVSRRSFEEQIALVPKAAQVLPELAQTYRLAIVSGTGSGLIKRLLNRYRLAELFPVIISSYDLPPAERKPSPLMLEAGLKALGVAPDRAWYIGDATTDLQMAKGAGVPCVIVLTGHLSQAEAERSGASHVIPSLSDLPSLLAKAK